jgi:hypothetical protein
MTMAFSTRNHVTGELERNGFKVIYDSEESLGERVRIRRDGDKLGMATSPERLASGW